MKRARRLTRVEKILLDKLGYDPEQYVCSGSDGKHLHFVHKDAGTPVTVER